MPKIILLCCLCGLTICTQAQTPSVQANVPRGLITGQTTVSLTPTAGATIRYTTDLTMPSRTNGKIYTQPIIIQTTTVLKTIAYNATAQSKVESFTYISPNKGSELTFPNLVTQAAYANGLKQLPIICISTPPNTVSFDDKTEQMCTFEYINKSGENANIGILAGVEGYGNDSYLYSEQKNLRISFKSAYGYSNLAHPIFARDEADTKNPVTKFDGLELKIGQDGPNADGYGMLMSSQGLISKTMRELGNIDVHTKYVHAFANGKYQGIYTLKERYDGHFASDYYGGKSADYDEIEGDWDAPAVKIKADGTSTSTLNTWNLLQAATEQNRYQDVKKYLNVSQFIDFMILMMYFDNEWEYRAFADKQLTRTKLVFQDYDTDGALTKISDENEFAYDAKWTDPAKTVFNGPSGLFGNLVRSNNPEFKALLKERVYNAFQKPNAPLTPARIQQKLEAMKTVLQPIFGMELARFNRTFYNDSPYFDQEYNDNVGHLQTRYNYNLNKWLGVLSTNRPLLAKQIIDNQLFTVVPNSNFNVANIDLAAAKGQPVVLTLHHFLGAAVLTQKIEHPNRIHHLSLEGVSMGQYVLTIQTEEHGVVGRKLFVNH